MRAYNERLVLTLVRQHGGLSKADIARSTGLSAQTVSVIMRSLENDGLLIRGEPIKGKVGQPSIPMFLSPGGAYAIGLKIGRRSAEVALVDFTGTLCRSVRDVYAYPRPDAMLAFAVGAIEECIASLTESQRQRVCGIGIATPFELWNWAEQLGAPQEAMQGWQGFDLGGELGKHFNLPVFTQNDATAACGAELAFGRGIDASDFVYFFIASFAGGGVVLNGSLFPGKSGNAGALGSLPICGREVGSVQLLEEASVFLLEQSIQERGLDPSAIWRNHDQWDCYDGLVDAWVERSSAALAQAIVAACSVIDFPLAVIDGVIPRNVCAQLVEQIKARIEDIDTQGISVPEITQGIVGANARTLGGASLPLFSRFMLDASVLIKRPD